MGRILIIDDHEGMREGMAVAVQKEGHQVTAARAGADGLALYQKQPFDLVVTDLKMDGLDGIEVVKQLKAADPEAVVMVVTAYGTIETAVRAMQEGAIDFLVKPFPPEVLRAKVAKGLELSQTRKQVQRLLAHNQTLAQEVAAAAGTLVGDSEPMQRLVNQARKAAVTDATILIQGESGTGKELVARMIHDLSPRRDEPFVVVHCAALAETLLESELFGHERGAFTGAIKRKLGRFELADRGTLFLDEVGEISPSVQTKLLRVLQEKEFERVGGEQTVKVDVRVVSATHRDLKAEVAKGAFREDLFYRLHILPLSLPALRERRDDVPVLARHFAAKSKINPRVRGLTDRALYALSQYDWPGNVRELENVIEQALVFAEGEMLDDVDLPPHVSRLAASAPAAPRIASASPPTPGQGPGPQDDRPLPEILEQVERQLIEAAYEKAGRVKTETARLLGIKTSALYYKLEKYGFIQKEESPPRES